MIFCKALWKFLRDDMKEEPKVGWNISPTYGPVYLLQEKHSHQLKNKKDMGNDGHYFVTATNITVAYTRCWDWQKGFKGDPRANERRATTMLQSLPQAVAAAMDARRALGPDEEGALPGGELISDDVQASITNNSFEEIMEAVRNEQKSEDVMRCIPRGLILHLTKTGPPGHVPFSVSRASTSHTAEPRATNTTATSPPSPPKSKAPPPQIHSQPPTDSLYSPSSPASPTDPPPNRRKFNAFQSAEEKKQSGPAMSEDSASDTSDGPPPWEQPVEVDNMAVVKYQGPVTIHAMVDPVPGASFEDQANALPKRDKIIQICQSDEMFTWVHALATILVINEKAVLGGLKVSEQLMVWQDRIRILKKPPWIFAPLNLCKTIENTTWAEAMTVRPVTGTDGLLTIASGTGSSYRVLPKITSYFGVIAALFKKLWDQAGDARNLGNGRQLRDRGLHHQGEKVRKMRIDHVVGDTPAKLRLLRPKLVDKRQSEALVVQAKDGLSEEDQKNTGNAVSVARKCKVEKLLELTPSKEVAGLFQLSKHAAGKPLKGDALGNPVASVKRDNLALVLHTSGTTKKPKIVPLTHANIASGAMCIASTVELKHEHICLNTMPLFHIHGLIVNVLASAIAGSQVVCLPGVFQVQNFHAALISQPEPNWYSAVPTMHLQILQFAEEVAKEKGKPPENKLQLIRNCSAALVPTVAAAMEEVLKVHVMPTYAMTESMPIASNPRCGKRKLRSVGMKAGPNMGIMNGHPDGTFLNVGEEGEVVVKGGPVTSGYEFREHMDANPNIEAFSEGWLRTGDKGWLDADGYLYLSGRFKEIINRAGEKISPFEVEDAMRANDAFKDCIAFAVPHKSLGEVVGIAAVLKDGKSLTIKELRSWCNKCDKLQAKWIPEMLVTMPTIPKGPTGKPARINLAKKLDLDPLEGVPKDLDHPGQHLISIVCGVLQCAVAAAMEYWHNSLPNCMKHIQQQLQEVQTSMGAAKVRSEGEVAAWQAIFADAREASERVAKKHAAQKVQKQELELEAKHLQELLEDISEEIKKLHTVQSGLEGERLQATERVRGELARIEAHGRHGQLEAELVCARRRVEELRMECESERRRCCKLVADLPPAEQRTSGNMTAAKQVTGEQQVRSFAAIPAGWNVFLPNFGLPKLSRRAPLDREASNVQPSFYGRVVMEPGSTNETRSLACGELAATPQVESLALLVERGLCTFRQKVPDMTAGSEVDDRAVEIPAWSIDLSDGQALRNWILGDARLVIQVSDSPRRPNIGPFQEDVFGLRQVFSK
ncbi:AAE3 [Symbiodinium sp. KB8]|nr:AAE3 [Symbiodinium sp. KB8]